MLGMQANLLGEFARIVDSISRGLKCKISNCIRLIHIRIGEAPLFNEPSGFHLWHNIRTVCVVKDGNIITSRAPNDLPESAGRSLRHYLKKPTFSNQPVGGKQANCAQMAAFLLCCMKSVDWHSGLPLVSVFWLSPETVCFYMLRLIWFPYTINNFRFTRFKKANSYHL